MVYLYLTNDIPGMTTDEKVRAILRRHYDRTGFCTAITDDALAVARGEKGKPYFPNVPGLHFSVSHSGKLFACAFASFPVGLDIQEYKNRSDESERCMKIARRFFHPDETDALERSTVSAFYKIWTAKEAYVKMTGQGIDGEFGDFCIFDLDCYLWQADHGNYSVAVCAEDICDVEMNELKNI